MRSACTCDLRAEPTGTKAAATHLRAGDGRPGRFRLSPDSKLRVGALGSVVYAVATTLKVDEPVAPWSEIYSEGIAFPGLKGMEVRDWRDRP